MDELFNLMLIDLFSLADLLSDPILNLILPCAFLILLPILQYIF